MRCQLQRLPSLASLDERRLDFDNQTAVIPFLRPIVLSTRQPKRFPGRRAGPAVGTSILSAFHASGAVHSIASTERCFVV